MASNLLFSLLLLLFLPSPPLAAAASVQTNTVFYRTQSLVESADASPITYFEVTKPIELPSAKACSYLLLRHDFGFTYGQPPVTAAYAPPADCPFQTFSKIVLEWSASCKGRQFDRIFGVWLGGVELLRSCSAEPTKSGIVWTVKKDVTRYHSLLLTNQTLAVYLGNLVDNVYTGVYHVNITLHFYPKLNKKLGLPIGADLILPISRNLPLNDGLWFEIVNSTSIPSKEFSIPQNSYRAVLEVYVSFHENDEFYYSNLPNDYLSANNISGAPGNGPFREVVVTLDDELFVGAVWPFTVIYTGGINPLLWRPITAIGSFDLPSYDIEITPFLGKLLDGKTHRLSFSVTNALNVWYVDANLHLWLDEKSPTTQGKLFEHKSSPLSLSLLAKITGLNGSLAANASRSIVSNGWVKSSRGNVTTRSSQEFVYMNSMRLGNDGNLQVLNQVVHLKNSVDATTPSLSLHFEESDKKFRTYVYTEDVSKGNDTVESRANVRLGINEKWRRGSEFGVSTGRLKNVQDGKGWILIKGHLVASGFGSTRQVYRYASGGSCYYRNVKSRNYTIVHDRESSACKKENWG